MEAGVFIFMTICLAAGLLLLTTNRQLVNDMTQTPTMQLISFIDDETERYVHTLSHHEFGTIRTMFYTYGMTGPFLQEVHKHQQQLLTHLKQTQAIETYCLLIANGFDVNEYVERQLRHRFIESFRTILPYEITD